MFGVKRKLKKATPSSVDRLKQSGKLKKPVETQVSVLRFNRTAKSTRASQNERTLDYYVAERFRKVRNSAHAPLLVSLCENATVSASNCDLQFNTTSLLFRNVLLLRGVGLQVSTQSRALLPLFCFSL